MADKRYFFDQDNSGHWYMVDASKEKQWAAWREIDEDDEAAWSPPDFAEMINTGPSNYTFIDPQKW